MRTLRQYWGKFFSRPRKPLRPGDHLAASPEELESESLCSRFESSRGTDSRKILGLETRLAELESERNQERYKTQALENTLAETASRLEKTDLQVKELQVNSVEQAKRIEASLSEANSRLEDTGNYIRELEDRLKNERQDYLSVLQDILGRLRKQDLRMNWMMSAAGAALLLGAVAGVILIWEMQRNATLLSSMSKDLKGLATSMNGHLSLQHKPKEEQQQLALPTTSSGTSDTVTANPQATQSSKTTISKDAPNPVLDASHNRGRERMQQATRADAKGFFERNAELEGVVSLPSGVQYRVVKPGSGRSPSLSDKVEVAYVGIKTDGTIFDETYNDGKPLTFSMKELLPGWQEVLLKMEEGAEFELYVPPNLATKGGVRKRSMLGFQPKLYLIELLQVVKEAAIEPDAQGN